MAVIYQITNMANGKFYIGSAESFERRAWQHRADLKRGVHKNPRLQAAWNKYGADAFVFEVLEVVPEGCTAFDVENTYLHRVVGTPDCYNVNTDAIGMRTGIPHTALTKARIAANRTAPTGANHYRYGTTLSAEVREKIGAAQRGVKKAPRVLTEAGRAKIKAAAAAGNYSHFQGKTHTEESKLKMSRAIIATNPAGIPTTYPSITALRETLGLKAPTVNRALKSGKPLVKGALAGWSFAPADPS